MPRQTARPCREIPPFAPDNLIDPLHGNTHMRRNRGLRQPHRFEKLLEQYDSRMGGRSVGRYHIVISDFVDGRLEGPLMVVDDPDLIGI